MKPWIALPACVFFVYLVVVAPIRARARLERLRTELRENPWARLRDYRRSMTRAWTLTALAALLFVANGGDAYGLHVVGPGTEPVVTLLYALGALAASVVYFRRRFARPDLTDKYAKQFAYVAYRLPRTVAERRAWVGISLTAGITEELLYRGFVAVAIQSVFGFDTILPLMVLTGLAFGFGHLYQGPKGVALTAFAGFALAGIAWTAGLVVAMVVHACIDLRILLLPNALLEAADEVAPKARSRATP